MTALDKYRREWEKAAAEKASAVAYANANKCDPGKDYWRAEWVARQKYDAALAIAEVMK